MVEHSHTVSTAAAAAIVGLINSSPRSPRQDEIETIIAKAIAPQPMATARLVELRRAIATVETAEEEAGPAETRTDASQGATSFTPRKTAPANTLSTPRPVVNIATAPASHFGRGPCSREPLGTDRSETTGAGRASAVGGGGETGDPRGLAFEPGGLALDGGTIASERGAPAVLGSIDKTVTSASAPTTS